MIILDYQPLTLGERAGMRYFANYLVPGYVTPCYATVRDTLLPAAMKDVGDKWMKLLSENNNFTVATDIWTSRRGHPRLYAFICTFITNQFEGKAVLLSCMYMPERHTGSNIRDVHELCLKRWNIADQVIRSV